MIPLFKKGDKTDVNNYRPVSLLSCVSKIMEKVIFKKVYNYIRDNNLISPHQSGFKPGDSTVNQLAYLYHTFCEAIDKKKDVRIVFCDISKAFDRVWHDGLIYKLKKFGIHGDLLNWFKDYLTDRQQKVIIRGQHSELGHIKAGVPQGSIVGPMLFLVYINDLINVVGSNARLFADDTSLYIDFDDPTEAKNILDTDLLNIQNWAKQWLVNFSPPKTKAMTVSFKKRPSPPLRFQDTDLADVDSHKHLGLTLSKNLSWSVHISNIIKSASPMADVLRKLKYKVDRESLEKIYFSFIRPKLEYGSEIWDGCKKQDAEMLENFQLDMARIVTGARRGTSHDLLYEELKWPLLRDRRYNKKIKHFCDIIEGNSPNYLSDLVPKPVNPHNLRNSKNIPPIKCRTEVFRRSFLPSSITLWNELPVEVRNIEAITKKEIIQRNKLFYLGNRETNIKHAQLRLKCSRLNGHLFLLHVIDSPRCACGSDLENSDHYLLWCPLYIVQRQSMMTEISQIFNHNIAGNDLLYGSDNADYVTNVKIFRLVHKFIEETNRL